MFFIIIIVFNYTKYCMLPMWNLEEIKLNYQAVKGKTPYN